MQLGIDIGGTYLRYELRENGKSIKKETLKSSQIGLCEFLEQILHKEKNIDNIYISYAGQVHNGVILSAPNINIDKHNIKAYIESKYGVKLYIENDLNCAVLAEAKEFKTDDISAIYIGTGLGLGVISSSCLIKGSDSIATELGHIPYKKSPFKCHCGKSNCLELFCSGRALERWKEYYNLNSKLTLQELANSNKKEAKEIYKNFIEGLFYGVGISITLFNPAVLVFGGGVFMHNRYLLNLIKKDITNYAMPLDLKNINITISHLKDASLEGAFLLGEKNV